MRRLARRLPGSRTLTTPALTVVLIALAGTTLAGALYSGLKLLGGEAEPVTLMALEAPASPDAEAQAVPATRAPAPTPRATPMREAPASTANTGAAARMQAGAQTQASAQTQAQDAAEVMMFNGRPLRKVRTLTMKVTAYSPDARSCGKWADGFTASGYSVWTNGMKLVAADTKLLPLGTIVTVPGYNRGKPVPVLDRGGAIKGHRLDVLYPTHEVARRWGVQELSVDVWEYADE